jgi:hypothetical protein
MTLNDAASLLSAVGTVGAFGVAIYLLSVQIRDRRGEASDRRAAQARLVSAWFDDVSPVNDVFAPAGESRPKFFEVIVLVRNGSTEPVYRVVVRTHVGNLGDYVRQPGTLGPGETRELRILVPPDDMHIGMPRVDILLRDSAGAQWMRRSDGAFTQPSVDDVKAFMQESPGAYPLEKHPTLNAGRGLDAHRGRRL